VFTVDPEATAAPAARNLAADRMLRQTFQVGETFFVGGIMLSFGSGGQDAGVNIAFYEVEDVNADAWAPVGNPLKRLTIPVGFDIPISTATNRMLFTLTGSDSFTLPAILTETGGYGIELSTGDGVTNMGPLRHSNTDGGAAENADDYLFGKFYTESGGQSGPGGRDLGLALIATDIAPPGPGDVDENFVVDLADLEIIRMHRREAVAGRPDGDLTGDGFVDVDDFREWKDNYTPPAGTAANIAIPEPASAGLAMSVLLLALTAAARRHS
jgi:hypothetical protein